MRLFAQKICSILPFTNFSNIFGWSIVINIMECLISKAVSTCRFSQNENIAFFSIFSSSSISFVSLVVCVIHYHNLQWIHKHKHKHIEIVNRCSFKFIKTNCSNTVIWINFQRDDVLLTFCRKHCLIWRVIFSSFSSMLFFFLLIWTDTHFSSSS